MARLSLAVSALLGTLAAAASTFEPLRPPALPLAVRNPYVNSYVPAGSDGGNGGYLPGNWPTFWNGAILGWTGMLRVDGDNYIWMGDPQVTGTVAKQISYEYTSTKSTFTMTLGSKVGLVVEFLSPVVKENLKKAGFPVSYMDVTVSSLDGGNHSIELYTDISAEWISGDRTNVAEWDYGVVSDKKNVLCKRADGQATNNEATGGVAYQHIYKQDQIQFGEVFDQTEYGDWYYATDNVAGLTYQTGESDDATRNQFVSKGSLSNTESSDFRAIDEDFPVFAFAIDLGSVTKKTKKSSLFTINLAQEKVIQFEGAKGNVSLPGLWTSYFSDGLDAVEYFYKDFAAAGTAANALDAQIQKDSVKANGNKYAAITSIATRQAFGALQFAGTSARPLLFMKEISSDGNVNTVDVIFPLHPILLYLNPYYLKLLLDPLYINQEAGYWPYKYAIHDIGAAFPNATGHNGKAAKDAEMQPLEECGDMVLMTLAYAQYSGDNAFLKSHYNLLKQWNTYLIKDALYPDNQISTDDFAGSLANQTNLAIKGIIGIKAMSEIATRVGDKTDAAKWSKIAQRYITKWQQLGINSKANPPHSNLAYHMPNSHGLLYNIWADKVLGTNIVPQSVFDMQSKFYPTVANKYGVPLDTRHNYTKADWEVFAAAVASKSTQNMFVNKLFLYLNQTSESGPFSDLYYTISGGHVVSPYFQARPVVGGVFAIVTLNQ